MAERVLIVDDDERLTAMLANLLRDHGMHAEVRSDGRSGLEAIEQLAPDAVVLDGMLPDIDGLDVLRRLRSGAAARRTTPVVMLTARGDDLDRILGLELGADDYLPKPFHPRELLARLRAVLRRGAWAQGESDSLVFGDLEIDRGARVVRLRGDERRLTSHQFELLWALASRAGRVQTRDHLMQSVRGENLEAFDRSIDVHVSKIRQAIEDDAAHPRRLLTVRGVGYVFATEAG